MSERRSAGRACLPRRRIDLVEDVAVWVLLALAMLVVVAGVAVGAEVDAQQAAQARSEVGNRYRVDAVLRESAPISFGGAGAPRPTVPVLASWTAPDGAVVTGEAFAVQGAGAGTVVAVWVDRYGARVAAPTDPARAVVAGVSSGLGIVVVGSGLTVALWSVVRGVTGTLTASRWEREWERVEPLGSRSTR